MNNTDLVTILGNLSKSLYPIQRLIFGLAYMIGILLFMVALKKLKKIADVTAQSHSQESIYTPIMYMIMGAALLFLPSTIEVMANTAFGVGNVLQYGSYNQYDIYSSMGLLIRTAGLIWFVRGSYLIAQASNPGAQEGMKGFVFLIAGVLAINFDNTIAMVNSFLGNVIDMTMSYKSSRGY